MSNPIDIQNAIAMLHSEGYQVVPPKEKIKVTDIRGVANDEHSIVIEFSERPTPEKYLAVTKAIERELNNNNENSIEHDLWCIADLLSRCWFYGKMKVETANERVIHGLLEKHGLYPTTEDAILMRPNWSELFLKYSTWSALPQIKLYTEKEIIAAKEEGFNAGRKVVKSGDQITQKDYSLLLYKDFSDYQNKK